MQIMTLSIEPFSQPLSPPLLRAIYPPPQEFENLPSPVNAENLGPCAECLESVHMARNKAPVLPVPSTTENTTSLERHSTEHLVFSVVVFRVRASTFNDTV